jgi:triacylglycerol lipase
MRAWVVAGVALVLAAAAMAVATVAVMREPTTSSSTEAQRPGTRPSSPGASQPGASPTGPRLQPRPQAPPAPPLRCATPRRPSPVVLVPGTFEATTWSPLKDALHARGYCVKTFNYPDAGTGAIQGSASDLKSFVNHVLAHTHAARVSLVTHSQGGVVARYYIRFLGGSARVKDLIALAPPNHGTTSPMIIPGAVMGCVACAQQAAGSRLLDRLNAGDSAPPPVDYTAIGTQYDFVVTPFDSTFLRGPANRVTNIIVQNACPSDFVTHITLPMDPVAIQWVEEALARNGPADRSFRPRC